MSNQRRRRHRTTPPPPDADAATKRKREKKQIEAFPLRIPAMLRLGVDGLRREPTALLLGAVLPFVGTIPFQILAAVAFDDDRTPAAITFTLTAMVLGGALAYPWCHYALAAARQEPVDLAAPFRDWVRFVPMLVASFWFWAGMLLAFQFQILGGLPALAIVMAYAFFGFVVDDRHDLGGLKALGTSVRIGDGRRFALLALAGLYAAIGVLVFMIAAAIVVSAGLTGAPASVVVAVLLLPLVAFSLVSWAALYDVLRKDLPDAW